MTFASGAPSARAERRIAVRCAISWPMSAALVRLCTSTSDRGSSCPGVLEVAVERAHPQRARGQLVRADRLGAHGVGSARFDLARVRDRQQGRHRNHVGGGGEGGQHGLATRHHGTRGGGRQGDAPAQGRRGGRRQPVRAGGLRGTQFTGLGSGAARGAVARQDLPFQARPGGDVGSGNPRRRSGPVPLSPSRLVTRTAATVAPGEGVRQTGGPLCRLMDRSGGRPG